VDVAFASRIIDRCLPILVLPVDIVLANINQILNHLVVALTTGIENGRLFQGILPGRVCAKAGESSDHAESDGLVRHDAS